MSQDKRKEEKSDENGEDEVAIALVAECFVGDKKFKAGETWTDPKHDCRMSICNPGGVISYLECPHFELEEGDEVRIPGDNKFAYPHCCDYVFRTKKKKEDQEEEIEDQDKEEKEEKDETQDHDKEKEGDESEVRKDKLKEEKNVHEKEEEGLPPA